MLKYQQCLEKKLGKQKLKGQSIFGLKLFGQNIAWTKCKGIRYLWTKIVWTKESMD